MTLWTTLEWRRLATWLFLSCVLSAQAQSIHPLTGIMTGHHVGGVSVDAVGNLFVADFGDIVWKIPPEGQPQVFAQGFYGSSGNVVDHQGNLFQSSYYGDFITRIDRAGHTTLFTSSGLRGPVGIATDATTGDLYVANCRGNTIARIGGDGVATLFARSDLLKCPNGIAFWGEPFTTNWPPTYSMSLGFASSRWAAIFLPFSLILSSDITMAVPPTEAERLP